MTEYIVIYNIESFWKIQECMPYRFLFITLRRPCGVWWLISRVDAFRPKSRGFESLSSRHVGTLGKSFTRSCFGVKLQHSIRAVSGAALSSSGLEEAL